MRTIVLANARVVTCNERNTIAGAIAIGDGQLLAVGDRDTVRAAAGPQAQVVDLGGRAVIPGLIDTHPTCCTSGRWPSRSSTSPTPAPSKTSLAGSPDEQASWHLASG